VVIMWLEVFAGRHLDPTRITLNSVGASGGLAMVAHYTADCETWASVSQEVFEWWWINAVGFGEGLVH